MILREMLVDDLDQVMEIEEELFSVPWTKEGFAGLKLTQVSLTNWAAGGDNSGQKKDF